MPGCARSPETVRVSSDLQKAILTACLIRRSTQVDVVHELMEFARIIMRGKNGFAFWPPTLCVYSFLFLYLSWLEIAGPIVMFRPCSLLSEQHFDMTLRRCGFVLGLGLCAVVINFRFFVDLLYS